MPERDRHETAGRPIEPPGFVYRQAARNRAVARTLLCLAILVAASIAVACGESATIPGGGSGVASARPAQSAGATQESVSLADLPLGEQVDASGGRLIGLPDGLTPIVAPPGPDTPASTAIVTVHGGGSEGYEWVYPLHEYVDHEAATYFYRWDWSECPAVAASELTGSLSRLLRGQPDIERLIVIGHSYGGVVVASMVSTWNETLILEAHVVAAPLTSDRGQCGEAPEFAIAESASLTQWRTRWEWDRAFRDLPFDPQLVEIAGSEVVLLPEAYAGNRPGPTGR